MRACLHQVFRPRERTSPPGCGDCRVCQTDPLGNQRCRCYQPVEITLYRIAGVREFLMHIDDVRMNHAGPVVSNPGR